jgi:hypothetical protein
MRPGRRQNSHLSIAPRRRAVSVRSAEASEPGFLDCLPIITAVGRIVAVAGVIAAVIRAAPIIAICAARDRATDEGTSKRAPSPTPTSITPASETSVSPAAAVPAAEGAWIERSATIDFMLATLVGKGAAWSVATVLAISAPANPRGPSTLDQIPQQICCYRQLCERGAASSDLLDRTADAYRFGMGREPVLGGLLAGLAV